MNLFVKIYQLILSILAYMQNVSKENERNLRQLILLPKQQQQENFSLLASSLRDTFNTVAVTMSVVALAVPKKLNPPL